MKNRYFLKTYRGIQVTGVFFVYLLLSVFLSCTDTVDKMNVTGLSTKATVTIDGTLCGGCIQKYCFEACPQRAISEHLINSNQYIYIIDPQKCTSCGVCISSCPYNAIIWKR